MMTEKTCKFLEFSISPNENAIDKPPNTAIPM
jgi:hypothetical protein